MNTDPPQRLLRFFRWFCNPGYVEDIEGDLLERYDSYIQDFGLRKAKRKLSWEILRLFRPGIIKPLLLNNSIIHPAMIQHNLLIAYRNNLRNKGTFLINLIGLSTGIACTILIGLWVMDELSTDKFHKNSSQLYQVMNHLILDDGIQTTHESSGGMAEILKNDFPAIKYVAAVAPTGWYNFNRLTLTVEEKNIQASGQFVGQDYFKVFSFDLLEGSPDNVLADKNSVVISESLAKNLFNTTENLIGKEILLLQEHPLLISGIFKAPPNNSTIQFEFAMSFDLCKDLYPWVEGWNLGPLVYALVEEDASIPQLNKELAKIPVKNWNDSTRKPFLTHFASNYLMGTYKEGKVSGGRILYVKLFSLVALFILLIACINFMNLSTARASRRLKEIGVKKAIGARRKTLISQYFTESILMVALSLILALILVSILLPDFNQITAKELHIPRTPYFFLSLFGIILITGLLAGSYPALYLSKFRAIEVIKGKLDTSFGDAWVRKGLVVFQFALAVIFITGIAVIFEQMHFIQRQEVGYAKDQVISFDIQGRISENRLVFLEELKRIPGVQNASASSHDMSGSSWYFWENMHWADSPPNPEEKVRIELAGVDFGLLETLDIQILEGRTFSTDFRTDSSQYIINEAAVEIMGNKESVVGELIHFGGHEGAEVVGVTKDFHFESLHEKVKPMLLFISPSSLKHIMVRMEAGQERETLKRIEAFYTQFNPGFTLNYKFLDEDYQAFYASEKRLASLSRYFAAIAIIISCLGILGLAAFTAERRQKEIGIRKVLGSGVWGLITLLTKDFTLMVLIAISAGIPLSYILARNWLENFAFKIQLHPGYFVGAAALTLLIAWLTVALQTYKAARLDPVACLKDE